MKYRMLRTGERIRRGDEYRINSSVDSWDKIKHTIGLKVKILDKRHFRRKVVARKI